jgi:hypothetical protein
LLAVISKPREILMMSDHREQESARRAEGRLQPFLDCVAYLLAKRWLRDQRQQEERPPRENTGAGLEEAD